LLNKLAKFFRSNGRSAVESQSNGSIMAVESKSNRSCQRAGTREVERREEAALNSSAE